MSSKQTGAGRCPRERSWSGISEPIMLLAMSSAFSVSAFPIVSEAFGGSPVAPDAGGEAEEAAPLLGFYAFATACPLTGAYPGSRYVDAIGICCRTTAREGMRDRCHLAKSPEGTYCPHVQVPRPSDPRHRWALKRCRQW
jgi:hypothetical protein